MAEHHHKLHDSATAAICSVLLLKQDIDSCQTSVEPYRQNRHSVNIFVRKCKGVQRALRFIPGTVSSFGFACGRVRYVTAL